MRRADRLFLIINALRGRRTALPARQLADMLEVSPRTVYRDVADLQLSGVPIEGEAGVGYMLRKGSDIPPLMFSADELEALVAGTRFVRSFAGERLAREAQSALIKIEAVLPPELRERSAKSKIFAPIWRDPEQNRIAAMLDCLHEAVLGRRVLCLAYRDVEGRASTREVEPLCLSFWGGSWTLGAWCRHRQAFRNFRPDRVESCKESGETFADLPGRDLQAYLDTMRVYYAGLE
ncbi:YafY family transcriptional regulator [Luteibacter aegosomatis]|uniref:helix-turn-helix transcriptional regulator n=1 Tax=Luteibacter aegosomatis TaxID=2911537 RepID=UPI001FF88A6A|nr:YafY family protein [Luteibacter aegosomatis]UPG85852.1 YafY family transcriptional regulator [Luteibacter aegosomatis]